MRKSFYFGAATLLGVLVGGHAALAETACQATLAQANAEWNAIGFTAPAKPLQARVALRDGHVSSGAEVTWLSSQMRFAAQDCIQGRDAESLHRLDLIQDRLKRL